MFKILLISIITFILVIIIFLLFISFLNNDINTNQKKIESFFGVEPTFTNCVKYVLPDRTCFRFNSNGTFTINNNITCDIFMIGGGGGAGYNHGSGGGAGAYYYGTNITLNSGTYNIYIGSGGNGGSYWTAPTNGGDTYITYNGNNDLKINGLNARCKGGGAGGHWNSPAGLAGGCGGGSDGWNGNIYTNSIYSGGGTNNDGTVGKGFVGGSARQYYYAGQLAAGGGGGIGGAGKNATGVTGGKGGDGLAINITGIELVFGGGGGGGDWPHYARTTPLGIGGGATLTNGTFINVGGDAVRAWEGQSGGDGIINTGSGGGGGKGGRGGNGGSGVVIIKINNDNNTYINENFSNIKKPWGIYFADTWTSDTLIDISGNLNNATTSGSITKTKGKGYGASVDIDYITGNTQTKINWPADSIPTNFTILSLTRYTGASRRRILSSDRTGGNFLHGHWENNKAVCHYDGWKTYPYKLTGNEWLCCIGKNGGSIPNNILMDGMPSGTSSGGVGNYKLCINDNPWNETSDWALSCVIIWNKHLLDEEMYLLNHYINIYMNTGNLSELKAKITPTDSIQENNNNNDARNIQSDSDIFTYNSTLYYYKIVYNNDNIDTNVNTNERSNKNNKNILTFYNNTYNTNGELARDKTADFITFKFNDIFILRKIIFKAKQTGTNTINAPASWDVYALNDKQYQLIGSGSATILDYISRTKSKSKNSYIHFLVEKSQIQSKEYKIVFKSIFGGNQLDFDNIVLWRGDNHSEIEATGASNFSLE